MCFSNVFSLAPEINDFFRCLRLWNFSTGGKATEWSTFLKTGPPKRTLYIQVLDIRYYSLLSQHPHMININMLLIKLLLLHALWLTSAKHVSQTSSVLIQIQVECWMEMVMHLARQLVVTISPRAILFQPVIFPIGRSLMGGHSDHQTPTSTATRDTSDLDLVEPAVMTANPCTETISCTIPVHPDDPPLPPKYNPDDYPDTSKKEEYSKVPRIRDPLPANPAPPPNPQITSVRPHAACLQGGCMLTIIGRRLYVDDPTIETKVYVGEVDCVDVKKVEGTTRLWSGR